MSFGCGSNPSRDRSGSFSLPKLSLRNPQQQSEGSSGNPAEPQRRSTLFNIVLTRVQGSPSKQSSQQHANHGTNGSFQSQSFHFSSNPPSALTGVRRSVILTPPPQVYITPEKSNRVNFEHPTPGMTGTPDSYGGSRGPMTPTPMTPLSPMTQMTPTRNSFSSYGGSHSMTVDVTSMPPIKGQPSPPSMFAYASPSSSSSSIGSSWSSELACLRQTGRSVRYDMWS